MLSLFYFALMFLLAAFVLVSRHSHLFSHVLMYCLGTIVFLFPGAITGTAELWVVNDSTAQMALFLILLSLPCFVIGERIVRSLVVFRHRPAFSFTPRITTPVLLLLLTVSLVIKLFIDPDTIIGRVLTNVERPDTVAGQYITVLIAYPTALACLCPWIWSCLERKHAINKLLLAACAVVGLINLSRTPVFYILGSWILLAAWRRTSRFDSVGVRAILMGILVGMTPLLIFAAALIKGSNLVVDSLVAGRGFDLEGAYEFAVADQYDLAVSDAYGNFLFVLDNYPANYDYMPGLTLAVLATSTIPRSEFPWKPWSASYHVTSQILGYDVYETVGTSLATSFLGELWMNGGWWATAIGSSFLGAVAGLFVLFLSRESSSLFRQNVFMMSLVMFILIPRGDVLSTFFRGMVYIAVAYVIGFLLARFCKRHGEPAQELHAMRSAPSRKQVLR